LTLVNIASAPFRSSRPVTINNLSCRNDNGSRSHLRPAGKMVMPAIEIHRPGKDAGVMTPSPELTQGKS
jgi:hypothetical protein